MITLHLSQTRNNAGELLSIRISFNRACHSGVFCPSQNLQKNARRPAYVLHGVFAAYVEIISNLTAYEYIYIFAS